MPLTCVSNDAILKKPVGLDYSNSSSSLPFTLNGSPFVNQLQSIVNKEEVVSYVIPGTPGKPATANSPAVGATPDSIGYKTINLNTKNIIGEVNETTLKYENKTYKQKFIAVHQGIWGDSRPHVSMLLLSPESDFFHICIPINVSNGEDENLFLKHWIHGGTPPSGFTFNQILNFRGKESVNFAIIQYCLKYNAGAKINPYTLCIFKQTINVSSIPWLTNFKDISKPTFDSVMNYMLNGMFKNNDGRIVSKEEHFGLGTTAVPTPSFFVVKTSELAGKLFNQKNPVKMLNNIKCYPIDLFNQIDDEGNIFIDEDSKKPIDVTNVNDPNNDLVKDPNSELLRQKSLNNLSFIVVFCITFGVICILIIVLTVWFFSGKPTSEATFTKIGPLPVAAAPIAPVAAPIAPVAAPIAPVAAAPLPVASAPIASAAGRAAAAAIAAISRVKSP